MSGLTMEARVNFDVRIFYHLGEHLTLQLAYLIDRHSAIRWLA